MGFNEMEFEVFEEILDYGDRLQLRLGRALISPITGDRTLCMGSSNDTIIQHGRNRVKAKSFALFSVYQ
jgi:methenyltetrahydromethanopterin cyclohydrolase